jgi:hypothetical protein
MPLPAYVDANDALYRHTGWTFGSLPAILGKVRARLERNVAWDLSHLDDSETPALEGLDHVDSRTVLEFLDTAHFIPTSQLPDNLTLNYSYSDGTFGASIVIGKVVPGSLTHTQGRHMGAFLSAQVLEQVGPETYTITA